MAITLTERAANHVQGFLTKRGKGLGLRLGVKTTGCSGMAYKLEFADESQPEDIVFESKGLKVMIDPKSLPALPFLPVRSCQGLMRPPDCFCF